jgi:predicted nucleic acid-binding protein
VILVDTSVWIEHLRRGDDRLAGELERGTVLGHPWVTGELALGHLERRAEILGLLDRLPQAPVATAREMRSLIERRALPGTGVGYVDVQLLAAAMLSGDGTLWTNDRRLSAVAGRLGLAFESRR